MTSGEKALLQAASLLTDSSRNLEAVVDVLDSIAQQQASVIDRLSDTLDSIGKNKSNAGNSKAEETALGGIANKFKSLTSSLSDLAEAGPKLKLGFEALTNGLKSLNMALTIFAKVPENSVDNLVKFLKNISDKFQDIDTKKIKEGGEGMDIISRGIARLGLVLFLSAPLFLVGAVGSLIVIPMIALYAFTFAQIGKVGPMIKEGAEAIGWMSLGLVGFSLSLFAVKELAGGSWQDYAKGSLIVLSGLTLFSLAFYALGQFASPIESGAKAAAWMGLGLISIAFGIASFQLLKIDMASVLIAGAAVAVTGLAMGLIGVFSTQIDEGAAALALGGIALIVLAFGIASFKLLKINSEDFLLAGAAIVTIGGGMALAGLLAVPILLGAAALLVASLALVTLAGGIWALNSVYSKAITGLLAPSSNDPKKTNLELVVGGVVSAFTINPFKSAAMLMGAGALLIASIAMITLSGGILAINFAYNKAKDGILSIDKNDPSELVINSVITGIVSAFTINPLKSAAMLLGAAGLLVASLSMITLAGGLLAFNFAYTRLKNSDLFGPSKGDPSQSNFEYTLGSIVDGFVMGPIKLAGFYLSIPAWTLAGLALVSIGAGISSFISLVQKQISIDKIGDAVASVLTSVTSVFAGVSKNGDLVDWDDVKDGINAVSGVGNLIRGIAEGVAKMADLKFPIYGKDGSITGYFGIGDKQFDMVKVNMKMLITSIAGTLTEIGKSQGETGWFSKSAGEKGADVIRGVGGDLVGLADFVQKAANLTFPIYDSNGKQTGVTTISPSMLSEGGSVRNNIISMIKAVSGALADVGSGAAASSGWFSDSDIEKGKVAIHGVAADLNGIAQMVSTVAEVKDFSQVAMRIKMTLMAIPQAFLEAAKIIGPNKAVLASVTEVMGTLINPLKDFIDLMARAEEKKITEKSASGLSLAITRILGSVSAIKPGADMKSLGVLVSYLEKMAAAADPLTKLANSFERIAKSMDKFAGTFKRMSPESVRASDMLIQSLVTFSKVDPNALSALSDKGQALISYIYEKGSNAAATNNKLAQPTPSNVIHSQPGQTPVQPMPVHVQAPAAKDKYYEQNQQMMVDLTANMAAMAAALKDIKMILSGTINVKQVNL